MPSLPEFLFHPPLDERVEVIGIHAVQKRHEAAATDADLSTNTHRGQLARLHKLIDVSH